MPSANHNEQSAVSIPPLYLRLPNTSFGIALGLAGHSILWKTADTSAFVSHEAASTLNWIFWTSGAFSAASLSALFLVKAYLNFDLVREEWNHPARCHFFNAPHLILTMLCMSVPVGINSNVHVLRGLWTLAALSQTLVTLSVYQRWMFDPASKLSKARPQFLLSTVGWFLLSVLASQVDLHGGWGIDLAAFFLGAGFMFYIMVVMAIFTSLHQVPSAKGSPALFLLIAPASVGCTALQALNDGVFGLGSSMVLGWCLILLLLLGRIGPVIMQRPPVLGVYWAYVFPLAGLATAGIKYAEEEDSAASMIMATVLMILAIAAVAVVFLRMTVHTIFVAMSADGHTWGDPLLLAPDRRQREELLESETSSGVGSGLGSLCAAVATNVECSVEDEEGGEHVLGSLTMESAHGLTMGSDIPVHRDATAHVETPVTAGERGGDVEKHHDGGTANSGTTISVPTTYGSLKSRISLASRKK